MGFIVSDVSATCKLVGSQLRRSGGGEVQRVCEGDKPLGGAKEEHQHNGEAGEAGEGELREDEKEVRRTTNSGGESRVKRALRVGVIGDFMLDRYWVGESERLSAEVPIPVVKIKDSFFQPGGAGNVAMNLQNLFGYGMTTFNYGGMLPTKNRLMVGDHQLARWDEHDSCKPWVGAIYTDGLDAIVVADYGKGAITAEIIEKIKRFGGPIFVDTKRNPSCWSGVATAVFPNWKEYLQFTLPYLNFKGMIVLKKGEEGLKLFRYAEKALASPAQARFIRSVNGAGDSVIAAFVYKYLVDSNETKSAVFYQCCLDFANAAAAIAVEHPYTYAPTIEEVEERYYQHA